jgi:hypothetical protein
MVIWVGAGLGGLIALVTTDLATGAPKIFNGILASSLVMSGGLLAKARVGFEWAATVLERRMKDDDLDEATAVPADLASWPKLNEFCWTLGLLATVVAAIVYLTAVWFAVDHKSPAKSPPSVPIIRVLAPRSPRGQRGRTGQRGSIGPRGPRGARGSSGDW